MHIAIAHYSFVRFYWQGRLRELARVLEMRGGRLSVIETVPEIRAVQLDSSYRYCNAKERYLDLSDESRRRSPRYLQKRLLEMLDEIQPDAVVAAPITFPEGGACIRWCKANRKPVVIMDDVRLEDVPRSKIVNIAKKAVYGNVDAMLIPAPSHMDSFIQWGIPKERLFYGVDVVDNEWFADRTSKLRMQAGELRSRYDMPDRFFLGVGRHVPKKNWLSLLNAYKVYRRSTMEPPWDLVLVGDGPDREKLLYSVKKENICGVHFVPSCSQAETCIYYALASAAILPSTAETWGLVINEAMASGLPVLVSNMCGCSDTLVSDGVNGWKFSPNDTAELSQLLGDMANQERASYEAMCDKSRAIISEWSVQRFADGVIASIESCAIQRCSLLGQIVLNIYPGRPCDAS